MIFFIVRGVFRGFFKEIGSLVGVILGIWLANYFQPQMTNSLRAHLPDTSFLPLISFAVVFVIVLVLCNLAGMGIKSLLKKIFLGWADRALGAGLAILKGVILTYLVIVLLTFFMPAKTPLIAKSKLAPLIVRSYQSIVSLISPGSYDSWKRKFQEKKRGLGKIGSELVQGLTGKDGTR
jgi:membrane protein required for colicin V production